MNKKLIKVFIALAVIVSSCKKDESTYDTSPLYPEVDAITTPSTSAVNTFFKNTSFYQLKMYRFDPEANKWGNNIGGNFVTVPADQPGVIGFTNPYVQDSGIPLFDMVRLYSSEIGSSNIKTAKINAPAVLKFYPQSEGATKGVVDVINQDVVITRANGTTFKIGISGQGTYDESTKVIDVEVVFNEKYLKEGQKRTFKYKLSVDALSLN